MKRIEFKDHDHRQLVSDLCAIAEKFHAHGSLRNRLAGAVGQFFDSNEIKSGASSSAAVPDALPPLPKYAGILEYSVSGEIYSRIENGYTAEQMQAYARAAVEAERRERDLAELIAEQLTTRLAAADAWIAEREAADRAQQGKPVTCLRCEGRGFYAVMGDAAGRVVNDKCRECGGSGRAAPAPDTGIPAAEKTDEPHPIESDFIQLEARAGEGA